jgi:radical SAM protein with 4Fe4S-binding SPASM domain
MCYEWGDAGSYNEKDKNNLACVDFATLERVVADCKPWRPYYEFFGGEPLLYPRIEDAIRSIRTAGSELAIPTNGVLIEKQAEMLLDAQPTRLWISLDGPAEINDRQRGRGVFRRVTRGIEKLSELRHDRGQEYPKLGVTFVVTPLNHMVIEEFFFDSIDLERLDHVSIEFQCYATHTEYEEYARSLHEEFGVPNAPSARGYVANIEAFANLDFESMARQIAAVKTRCLEKGIMFVAHPLTIDADSYRHYFQAHWTEMSDHRTSCVFPWTYAEIAANGDVTPCHSFYDYPIGNLREAGILDIWRGERARKLRAYLRKRLFPICTACCRYYNNPISALNGARVSL